MNVKKKPVAVVTGAVHQPFVMIYKHGQAEVVGVRP